MVIYFKIKLLFEKYTWINQILDKIWKVMGMHTKLKYFLSSNQTTIRLIKHSQNA